MYFKMESHDKQWYNSKYFESLHCSVEKFCLEWLWLPFVPELLKHGRKIHFAFDRVLFLFCLFLQTIAQTQPDGMEFSNPSETATLEIVKRPTKAKKIAPIVENKPLIYQPKEAMGSPEKAGQCCHFQSDWHWAVSLHSTVHDSALVANTGSSVTAAVQSKIVWKHEWMIWSTKKKVMLKVSDACRSMKRTRDGWTDDRQRDRQIGFWQTIKRQTTSSGWKRQKGKKKKSADVNEFWPRLLWIPSYFPQRVNVSTGNKL